MWIERCEYMKTQDLPQRLERSILLQQQNDDLTFGLEERVISPKARIREMKMKIGELDPKVEKNQK